MMTEQERNTIIELVAKTLVKAGSAFPEHRRNAYARAIGRESNPQTKWVMETILKNADVAENNGSPLCDDTGIPHLLIDIGETAFFSGEYLSLIQLGVAEGLRQLPGRPMAVRGDERQRLAQSEGMFEEPEALLAAPYAVRQVSGDKVRVHVLMLGGGPAIRAKTYRVFHKHSADIVMDEIVSWATEAVKLLGCSPCTLAVGIGRSHYEASSLMLQAMADGNYDMQSELEQTITDRVNKTNVGALGLGGDTSVLGTFLKVGPQRASGVRIVCLRPCCCFEPRVASTEFPLMK